MAERDARALELTIGVVGGDADVDRATVGEHEWLDLAGGGGADDLHDGVLHELVGRHAVEERHRARARHADRGELGDVVLDRAGVARPAQPAIASCSIAIGRVVSPAADSIVTVKLHRGSIAADLRRCSVSDAPAGASS